MSQVVDGSNLPGSSLGKIMILTFTDPKCLTPTLMKALQNYIHFAESSQSHVFKCNTDIKTSLCRLSFGNYNLKLLITDV